MVAARQQLFLYGTEIAFHTDWEQTRETSSSLEDARIGIAAGHNACHFIGFHGCNVAWSALAGQHHRLSEGDHPFALGYEERELRPASAPISARIQPKILSSNDNGSLAAPVALRFFELGTPIRLPA